MMTSMHYKDNYKLETVQSFQLDNNSSKCIEMQYQGVVKPYKPGSMSKVCIFKLIAMHNLAHHEAIPRKKTFSSLSNYTCNDADGVNH